MNNITAREVYMLLFVIIFNNGGLALSLIRKLVIGPI